MNNWDIKFIGQAREVAQWSKDTNRKNGAVVVNDDNIVLSQGYNGLPIGCDDSIESRFVQPTKYLFTEHAERNALYFAARTGVSLKGARMYMTMFPCADCARGMIQCGLKKIIAPTPDVDHLKWGEHFKAAMVMLEEANVEIELY
jgi:dCMP deaminase